MQTRRVADDTPALPCEVALQEGIELVATACRLAHDRVSRVLVYFELVERIDDKSELHSGTRELLSGSNDGVAGRRSRSGRVGRRGQVFERVLGPLELDR